MALLFARLAGAPNRRPAPIPVCRKNRASHDCGGNGLISAVFGAGPRCLSQFGAAPLCGPAPACTDMVPPAAPGYAAGSSAARIRFLPQPRASRPIAAPEPPR